MTEKKYVKVKNLNGTGRFTRPKNDPSWIAGWKRIKGYSQNVDLSCSNILCENDESGLYLTIVGAHVQLADGNDKNWYIVPLCSSCNAKSSEVEFLVNKDYLVPVNEINK